METLGSIKASVERFVRGSVNSDLLTDAINDAIESLWMSVVQFQMEMFLQGPVSLSLAAGAQRTTLVSVEDPASAPSASVIADTGAIADRNYQLSFTLVTESGSETAESPILPASVATGYIASISSPAYVSGAIGWNLYAGTPTTPRLLQNAMPIAFGDSYQEPPGGFVSDVQAAHAPTINTTGDNIFAVDLLEVTTSNNTLKPWSQHSFNSLMMKRGGRTIASTSEYQGYVWDLVNETQIEVRPALGATLNPRYFYIAKPRRLKFDTAPIPYNMPGATQFIRQKAISDALLSLHEYDAARLWEEKAEPHRVNILQAVLARGINQNTTITPFIP